VQKQIEVFAEFKTRRGERWSRRSAAPHSVTKTLEVCSHRLYVARSKVTS